MGDVGEVVLSRRLSRLLQLQLHRFSEITCFDNAHGYRNSFSHRFVLPPSERAAPSQHCHHHSLGWLCLELELVEGQGLPHPPYYHYRTLPLPWPILFVRVNPQVTPTVDFFPVQDTPYSVSLPKVGIIASIDHLQQSQREC